MTHSIDQLINTAVNQHQHGQFHQAEQLYCQILQIQPKHAYILNLLGVLHAQAKNDHKQAKKLIRKAIKIDPSVSDYHNNLGLSLHQLGEYKEAAWSFEKATRLNPLFIHAWFGYANSNLKLNKTEEAISCFKKVIKLDANFVPAYNNLGNIFRELKQFDQALEMFEMTLKLNPGMAEAYYNIGIVKKQQGYFKEAIDAYDKVLAINPDDVKACFNKATSLQRLGKFDKAKELYCKVIELKNDYTDAYANIVQLQKYTSPEHKDAVNIKSLLENDDLNEEARINLHFALGKIYDDCSTYNNAFQHFQIANQLKHKKLDYNPAAFEKYVSDIIDTFSSFAIEEKCNIADKNDKPIFIVGMPRSGTTLIEQIIASHSDVFGANELPFINELARSLPKRLNTNADYPQCLSQMENTVCKDVAEEYINELNKLDGSAKRLTDKMPYNFLHLGLIALCFPGSKIIHCNRHPLDTCLSIYFCDFHGSPSYAYNLEEIAHYYSQYSRLMAFWKEYLSIPIFNIDYEHLIDNRDKISRQMIEFLGLEWDGKCLDYHKTDRAIKTASLWQVRQRVYKTSLNRWRNYKEFIQPLNDKLSINQHI